MRKTVVKNHTKTYRKTDTTTKEYIYNHTQLKHTLYYDRLRPHINHTPFGIGKQPQIKTKTLRRHEVRRHASTLDLVFTTSFKVISRVEALRVDPYETTVDKIWRKESREKENLCENSGDMQGVVEDKHRSKNKCLLNNTDRYFLAEDYTVSRVGKQGGFLNGSVWPITLVKPIDTLDRSRHNKTYVGSKNLVKGPRVSKKLCGLFLGGTFLGPLLSRRFSEKSKISLLTSRRRKKSNQRRGNLNTSSVSLIMPSTCRSQYTQDVGKCTTLLRRDRLDRYIHRPVTRTTFSHIGRK